MQFTPYLISDILQSSVQEHPENLAVLSSNNSITYSNLDQASNCFANVLKKAGINRGDRVGIYLKKSIETIIAILGTLKVGAVYVPLDPNAPAKRIAFIIDDCQIKVMTSSASLMKSLKDYFSKLSSVHCLILTDEIESLELEKNQLLDTPTITWQEVLSSSATQPSNQLTENDLAYILYTSGSTGSPKGVMISHRASLTFINWAYSYFKLRPSDRVSSHAPFHFDLSIFDLFVTLKAGGSIVLVPPQLSVFPLNLAKFIQDQKINIWYSVPSILTQLVLRGNLSQFDLSNLKSILFAGEVFPTKYLIQLMNALPQAKFYNLYGPTETNVCTYYPVAPITSVDHNKNIPIGKACANTEVFLLKENGEIAKSGEVGELCVRGPSLMSGYWNLPKRTQQSLTPHALHPNLGLEKIYKTGDLVKQSSLGDYIYLGRRDNQIKSRGYRIELGEIETVIYNHPDVLEAAVIAIPNEQIGHEIKAVIVLQAEKTLPKWELEKFISARIPKYMVPGIIEFTDKLPKTSTGKVDRNQLKIGH